MKVELLNLTQRRGEKTVLEGLCLTLESGSASVLIGPSGVGKTSLLRIMAGLDEPVSGVVKLDGRTVNNPHSTVPAHRRGIGMVFQDLALWPHLTVLDNVDTVCQDREKSLKLLSKVGWNNRLNDYPDQLSAGERQRVALARTLAGNPRLVLLDEPLLNLDPVSRVALLQQLMRLHREMGFTLLYVTHYLDEALLLGERLIFLMNGRLELEGPLEEILRCSLSPELRKFLHLPGSLDAIAPNLEAFSLEPQGEMREAKVSEALFTREEGLYKVELDGAHFHVLARVRLQTGQSVYVRLVEHD